MSENESTEIAQEELEHMGAGALPVEEEQS